MNQRSARRSEARTASELTEVNGRETSPKQLHSAAAGDPAVDQPSRFLFHQFEGQSLRILLKKGDPWFVVADTCRALNLRPHKGSYVRHIAKLDEDEKAQVSRDAILNATPRLKGGVVGGSPQAPASTSEPADPLEDENGPNAWVISESGLYTIIVRSRAATTPGTLPHRFRRWITGEVLPSIRKTGSYLPPSDKPNRLGVEFSEPGRYVTMVVPGLATHTQHYRLEALLDDVAENEAVLMALTMKMVEAWWHKAEHLAAIGLETRGSFAAAGLERAIREGATLADRLFALQHRGAKLTRINEGGRASKPEKHTHST